MSYSSTVLSLSPTVYYPLQDSLADNSGGGRAAVIRGASAAEPAYATGIVDAAPRGLNFDGVNDYAYIPNFGNSSNKQSFVFWANFAAFSGTQVILEQGANYNSSPTLGAVTDGRILVYSDASNLQVSMIGNDGAGGSYAYDTYVFPLPGTNDMMFTLTCDRSITGTGRMKLYYNDIAQTSSSTTNQTGTSDFRTTDLYWMSRGGGSFFTGGLIDDFAAWIGTVVTAGNVSTLYAAGTAPIPGGPVSSRRRPLGLYTR